MPQTLDRTDSPFRLGPPLPNALAQGALALAEKALGLEELDHLYPRFQSLCGEPWDAALEVLQVGVDLHGNLDLPAAGPVLVVANHPLGGLEGVALLKLLKAKRPDTLLVASQLLRVPELQPHLIGLDLFGPRSRHLSARTLRTGLRQALRHLRSGGCLACFPAGETSNLDLPWNPWVVRLAQRAKAPVLPLWFAGKGSNPAASQAARLLHHTIRSMLVAKKVLKRQGTTLRVEAGGLIQAKRLASLAPDQAIALVRSHTALLANRLEAPAPGTATAPAPHRARAQEPLAAPQDPAALAAEFAALPPEQRLATGGGLEVWIARAPQVPAVLLELGLERERAFRAVGEGTGKSRDLDRFDEWYLHLLLWDPARSRLAGGYRMGPTDEILAQRGKAGLYTTTLFHMSSGLLRQIDPALEMGRSFLRDGYQGTHGPLMLLWKGIGRWLLLHPRYRRLFGAVSISDAYRPISRALMARWCSRHLRLAGANPLRVMPRRPFFAKLDGEVRGLPDQLSDFEALDEAVSLLEGDKGVPVLFKHYARLGGRFAGFNVDPGFGDALDGLVVVDLAETDTRLLGMYMGREEAKAFQARHRGDGT
ncbi:MAG TPA: GNAT family N-acyltransferase [Anaeromyxobacter sp.]|nr:GNAT family N-acyltransferase [Anaeromyxobacter sp.]